MFHSPYHFDPILTGPTRPSALRCLLVNLPLIGSLPGLQQPACDAYIKRVIGLPGERVVVDPRGRVSINGRPLDEPYVRNYCPVDRQGVGPCRTIDVVVPPGHLVVLGDNRANSWDGRFWPGGPLLPESELIGRAFWRFFPFSPAGPLPAAQPAGSVSPVAITRPCSRRSRQGLLAAREPSASSAQRQAWAGSNSSQRRLPGARIGSGRPRNRLGPQQRACQSCSGRQP